MATPVENRTDKTANGDKNKTYTVVWFAVGAHGYHEISLSEIGTAHQALAAVQKDLSADLRIRAKFRVFVGTPLRRTQYCMNNTTFLD